jgi:hypothetical protein
VWVVGQIHLWQHGLVSGSLVQAMQHPIQMRTAVGQRFLNGLLDQVSGILLV